MKTKKKVRFNDKVSVKYYNKDAQIIYPVKTKKNNKILIILVLLLISFFLLTVLY